MKEPDDVAAKIMFWKQVHGLPDFERDGPSEKNYTIDMFDEILRDNYDDILSESVDEKFHLLLESNQDVTQELAIIVTPVPKKNDIQRIHPHPPRGGFNGGDFSTLRSAPPVGLSRF